MPGFINWVENGNPKKTAAQCIRQTSHPLLQVTGGYLTQASSHDPFLLIFGQDFKGYYRPGSNGVYTQQIRSFQIIDNGDKFYIQLGKQSNPNPNYRRRDLNVLPIIQKMSKAYNPAFVALSGVFTEEGGVWTVPVCINADSSSFMPNPETLSVFKQGMNGYETARVGLFSKKTNDMYMMLFGGISYLFVNNGSIDSDPQIPFINSVTTIKLDSKGGFQQYLMDNEYPVILSTFSNPGNVLLFGAEARFIPVGDLPTFSNGVIALDSLSSSPTVLGYIVGGIQSTLPNTNSLVILRHHPIFLL